METIPGSEAVTPANSAPPTPRHSTAKENDAPPRLSTHVLDIGEAPTVTEDASPYTDTDTAAPSAGGGWRSFLFGGRPAPEAEVTSLRAASAEDPVVV